MTGSTNAALEFDLQQELQLLYAGTLEAVLKGTVHADLAECRSRIERALIERMALKIQNEALQEKLAERNQSAKILHIADS